MTRYIAIALLLGVSSLAAREYTKSEVDELIRENKELRSELQKESKAAIDARNHAKTLFDELRKLSPANS